MQLGNPPGKPGSCGDAVNWEALLQGCPNGEDLELVSEDRDYASPLDDTRMSGAIDDGLNAAVREWPRNARPEGR
jgi:hypothetical protein